MKVQREDLLYKLIYMLSLPTFYSILIYFFPHCELKPVQISVHYYVAFGVSDLFPRKAWRWHSVNEPPFLIPLLKHDTGVVKSVICYPLFQSINQSTNQPNLLLRLQSTTEVMAADVLFWKPLPEVRLSSVQLTLTWVSAQLGQSRRETMERNKTRWRDSPSGREKCLFLISF